MRNYNIQANNGRIQILNSKLCNAQNTFQSHKVFAATCRPSDLNAFIP